MSPANPNHQRFADHQVNADNPIFNRPLTETPVKESLEQNAVQQGRPESSDNLTPATLNESPATSPAPYEGEPDETVTTEPAAEPQDTEEVAASE